MSNMEIARKAILAELDHVEEGIEYFQRRASALRSTLEQLDLTDAPPQAQTKHSKSKGTTTKKRGGSAPSSGSAESGRSLPKTSQDFWLRFIGKEPKTAAEIGQDAADSLGFKATPEQAKKLKARLAPTLQMMLSSKKIKDTGSGRERKYTLAAGAAKGRQKGKAAEATATLLSNSTVH